MKEILSIGGVLLLVLAISTVVSSLLYSFVIWDMEWFFTSWEGWRFWFLTTFVIGSSSR